MRRLGILIAVLALFCVAAEQAKPPEKPTIGPNEQAVTDLLKSVGIEQPSASDILAKFVLLSDGRLRESDTTEQKAAFFMSHIHAAIRAFVAENYVKAVTIQETQALQRKQMEATRVFKIGQEVAIPTGQPRE